jgi:hypothetical protein
LLHTGQKPGKEIIREEYLHEAVILSKREEKEGRKLLVLSVLRLVVFVSGFILAWLGFTLGPVYGILILLFSTGVFLYLLKLFSLHSHRKIFLGNIALLNRNEAAALTGDLSPFDNGDRYIDRDHFFSYDVDLFGDNSLFQFLNRCVTGYGREVLADWLQSPYNLRTELVRRQEAVKELAERREWRHRFLASGMNKSLEKRDIDRFDSWLKEEPFSLSPVLNLILTRILPLASLFTLAGTIAGIFPYPVFTTIFILNLLIVSSSLRAINLRHRSLTGAHNYLSSLQQLISVFENESFNSEILADIRKEIAGEEISAAVALKRMTKLLQAFDTRLNVLIGFLLNGLLLWDFQCIQRLERWKEKYKSEFPRWLEMTGQIDAFVSLAGFAYNNPGFTYPSLAGDETILSFKSAGHPLISEEKRVCNDFEISHKGKICIITGANMSGKSTFLRTVAIDYILGMAGAPVCAEEMVFRPLKLFTSMRTTDSLSGNESYFYAELRRLRFLKDEIGNDEPVLFILDEILKGTNSADKSLGSRLFMKKMISHGGTGLIATHDISLGELENEFPEAVYNMCFEIEIEGETIKFDYILRSGITGKMNAAILMKQMGILD